MKIFKTSNYKKIAEINLVVLLMLLVAEDVKERMRAGEEMDSAIDSAIANCRAKAPKGGDAWEQIRPDLKEYIMGSQGQIQTPAQTPTQTPTPDQQIPQI